MDSDIKVCMDQREKWYGDAIDYWENISADVHGMLGGFEHISPVDIRGSNKFLEDLKKENLWTSGSGRAVDCGAGIGRVAKHFLLPIFDIVDLVEQNAGFLEQAKTELAQYTDKVGEFYAQGLQDFRPAEKHYDIIWFQWVVGQLTDEDFVSCLKRCKNGLKKGGCICIKDNIAGMNAAFDAQDSSVMRTHAQFVKIFKASGLKVLAQETQKDFPSSLHKVYMYALV